MPVEKVFSVPVTYTVDRYINTAAMYRQKIGLIADPLQPNIRNPAAKQDLFDYSFVSEV
jgi:hypothetical protein